ncbi:hypothetical protein PoMZ_03481 [Pyricularia oryzae]|uniref:F-box domain-containing protein n=1 Tax=Pyricularia oryzae TaxID=318829 RepID=A0A4P7N783_PYROR|nr:hypothetical protein PoMZ_03481 [Pyricularia oryzae]
MPIQDLVWELVSHIAQEFDAQDLFNFSLSCRTLQQLIWDNHICAMVLEGVEEFGSFRSLTLIVFTWKSTAPFAPETKAAHKSKNYAKVLRLIVKRRTAILSASSYLAAVVAEAESFLYSSGVLCYLSNGLLKIRDLHNSALEDIISIGKLLEVEDHLFGTIKDEHFKLRILNYADSFVSCYLNPGNRSFPRLLIISLSHGRLFSHTFASSRKIFRWVLRGCNLLNGTWQNDLTHLPDRIGSDIGANICFEIIDGYFYALGIQRDSLYNSYICVRFRIDQSKNMEEWQEFHYEGPANIQRTFIAQDERIGVLNIVQGRVKSGEGPSANKMTYYRRRLQFPGDGDKSALSSPGPLTTAGYGEPSSVTHASDQNAANLRLLTPNDSVFWCYSDRPLRSQRIRLRINLAHFTASATPNAGSPTRDQRVERHMSRINLWSPPDWDNDKNVKALNAIFSPQFEQNFIGMWDERLKCYTQGGLLNTVLDPSIRLQGNRRWVNAFLEVLGEDLGASCPESRIQDPDPSANSAYEVVWVTEVMAFHRCAEKGEINPTVWYYNKVIIGQAFLVLHTPQEEDYIGAKFCRSNRGCKTRSGANLNETIAISTAAHRTGQGGGWDGLTLV